MPAASATSAPCSGAACCAAAPVAAPAAVPGPVPQMWKYNFCNTRQAREFQMSTQNCFGLNPFQ